MSKNNTAVQMFEAALNEWCGSEKRRRLDAVAGGAATGELITKLRASDKRDLYEICCQHANERAEDICYYLKPGDLFYRDGSYLWCFYWKEIQDALRAVGAGRVRQRKAMDIAEKAFIERVERIRTLRIGTPEKRKAKEETGFEGMEFSETVAEYCERRKREVHHG
ncbi:hypothetical protein AAII07_54295 [Microvirga sp. 0TCS3.31]